MENLNFRKITEEDLKSIDKLLVDTFPNSHSNRAVIKLRVGATPILDYSMVAVNEVDEIVAQINFYYVKLPSSKVVPMLGPLSVINSYRGQGLGNTMIEYGLFQLSGLEDGVLIVGPEGYYEEYGFDTECVKDLTLDGEITPFQLMGLEFEDGIFSNESGRVTLS